MYWLVHPVVLVLVVFLATVNCQVFLAIQTNETQEINLFCAW
jgi:hypothetical protein